MKKTIAACIVGAVMLTGSPAFAADPTPPSGWVLPNNGGVVKYYGKINGKDCWRFHRVMKCVK